MIGRSREDDERNSGREREGGETREAARTPRPAANSKARRHGRAGDFARSSSTFNGRPVATPPGVWFVYTHRAAAYRAI